MTKYQVTMNIPADYYTAIGAVANKWAVLEYIMQLTIWRILELDVKSGRCLTGGMVAKAIGATLKNVASLHLTDSALRDDLVKFKNDVLGLEERRNEFVHCVWGLPVGTDSSPPALLITRTAAQRLQPDVEALTSEDALNFANRLHELAVLGNGLSMRVRNWREAQNQASAPQTAEGDPPPVQTPKEIQPQRPTSAG